MRFTPTNHGGFTLVEVLVVSPIIILFIGAFVALLVTLTGESLVVREKNVIIHDTQSALDSIQADISQSTSFLSNTPSLTPPQGSNNSTAPFTDVTSGQNDALIMQLPATNAAPSNPARTLIYVGTPGSCDSKNALQTYTVVYFVGDDGDTTASGDVALFKRVILPTSSSCATIWQRGTCRASVMTTGNLSTCMASDERLIGGASEITFEVKYYNYVSGASTAARDNNATTATDASAAITVSEQIAGETVTHTASVRATSLNTQVTQ